MKRYKFLSLRGRDSNCARGNLTIFSLLLMVAFVVPVFASAATSAGVTPGSFWYFFDTASEKIALFFTFNPENKAKKALEYADERLAEVDAIAGGKNPDAIKAAIADYEGNVALATEKSKEVKDKGQAESLFASIESSASKNQEVLSAVLIKVPEEAKAAITQAIEASKKGQEEAARQIADLKGEVEKLKQEVAELKAKDEEKQRSIEELSKKKAENTTAPVKSVTPQAPEVTPTIKPVAPATQTPTKTTNIVTLPNGAVVEMSENGNILRTIKEAPQPTYVDVCKNIEGTQTAVPSGMQWDNNQNCISSQSIARPTTTVDLCSNIEGAQSYIPTGMTATGNVCVIAQVTSPQPTQSPVTVDLKVNGSYNPSAVAPNSQVDVTWTSDNAVSCLTYGSNLDLVGGGSAYSVGSTLPTSGNLKLTIGHTLGSVLTLSIQCSGPYPNPSIVSKSISLSVVSPITSGSLNASLDSSFPLYKVVFPDTSNIELARIKYTATDEDINVKQVALKFSRPTTSSPADLVGQKVQLYTTSGTLVGQTQFGLGADPNSAISSLTTDFVVPMNGSNILVVKGIIANIGDVGSSGDLFAVGYDSSNVGTSGNYGVGVTSGAIINGSTNSTTSNGIRIMRSVPTLTDVTTSTSLVPGSDLYAIKVTAGTGHDIGISRMSFRIGGWTAKDFQLVGPSGAVNAIPVNPTASYDSVDIPNRVTIIFDSGAIDRVVNAGTSKTYRLRANTITGLTALNVESLSVQLVADSVPPEPNFLAPVAAVAAGGDNANNFIWTPFSVTLPTTSSTADSNPDFTNSYGVLGFPGLGQSMQGRLFSH